MIGEKALAVALRGEKVAGWPRSFLWTMIGAVAAHDHIQRLRRRGK